MKTDTTASQSGASEKKQHKMGKFKRILTIASGSLMLYRAIKRKNLKKGIGAGVLLVRGVRG